MRQLRARFPKSMKNFQRWLLPATIILLVAGVAGTFLFREIGRLSRPIEKPFIPTFFSNQEKQDGFITRIKEQDPLAFDEYKKWAKTQTRIFEYPVRAGFAYWFFPGASNYGTDYDRSNVVIIDKDGVQTPVILSESKMEVVGVRQDGSFIVKNNVEYEADSSEYGCVWDQSAYMIDPDGTVRNVVTEKKCGEGLEHIVIFHARKGVREEDIRLKAGMDGETDSFVLRSESGTSVAIPYTQKSVLGLGLNSFLLEGDMRSFSLPMWDPYRSHSTTTVFLRPTLELDQTTVAVRDCENKLANAIAGVRAGDKEQLKVFERCMVVLKYPYKKFPIPGGDSYYGFLGNASNRIIGWSLDGTSSDSVWCQMDGMPNECLLFKAEKGIPTYYPPSKNGKDLRQMEFLRAEKDGTLLVHHFPYEIVYFQTYAKFDPAAFEDVTEVVQYFGGSFAAPDEPRSLTFYPRGEAIKFIIGGGLLEEGYIATTTLSFDGKLIGSFETAQTQAFEEGDYFPDTTDLRAYALQSDKTKFYFTAGGTRYTLDLTPAVPKLLKR